MRYCYLPICLAAGLLFSTSLKALDLGFVDFGGAVTLDSTSGEMDYLFIDFSGESFQVVETTGAVSPVTPMPVFGDTNDGAIRLGNYAGGFLDYHRQFDWFRFK